MFILPLLTAVVATLLTARTARAALLGRRPSLAVWSFALAQFAVGSGAFAWGVGFGWTAATYRTFYLFGAVLNVAWLGLGTVWLFEPRRLAPVASLGLLAVSVYAGIAVATTELLPAAAMSLATELVPSPGDVVPAGVRELSRWFSIGGSVVVLGGLAWSVLTERTRALGLGLLAGGIVVAGVGSALGRAGVVAGLSVGLAVGIILMYAGFVRSETRL